MREAAEMAGVEKEDQPPHLPSQLRHALLEGGANLQAIQLLLGREIASGDGDLHPHRPRKLREQVERYHAIAERGRSVPPHPDIRISQEAGEHRLSSLLACISLGEGYSLTIVTYRCLMRSFTRKRPTRSAPK